MHNHLEEKLIIKILSIIAKKKHKPLEDIKRLLLINQDPDINKQFWKILDKKLPNHGYEYVGCCAGCGSFELTNTPPYYSI
jgi:hypothetical protein